MNNGLKEQIKEKITEVKLNIEHTKRASPLAKAKPAEAAITSAVECIHLMAHAMGVYDE